MRIVELGGRPVSCVETHPLHDNLNAQCQRQGAQIIQVYVPARGLRQSRHQVQALLMRQRVVSKYGEVNVTVRALYRNEGDIDGHYHGPHNHGSPPDFQENYGGDTLDIGIGLNVVIPRGPLQGNRLGIEALLPVYQDLNGIQIERDFTLVAGWQWSF